MVDKERWIRFDPTADERAVLDTALDELDTQDIDFYDLCADDGQFVYGGNIFKLKQALTEVSKHDSGPAARDVRLRIANIQRSQKDARGELP